MYRNVLFTDKEIAILSSVLNEYLYEKNTSQRANLTIILARLRQIKPLKKYNQTLNYGKWTLMKNESKQEIVYHIIKYVGGILDGSTTEIFTENIPFLTCVVNFEAKTAHYYHLVSDKVVDSSGVEFLQTYYSFYISKELTKDNEKYLEDHCKEYKELINKYYEENNQKENK